MLQPTYTVTTGQSITLGCSVSGIPAATSVLWKRTSGGVTTDIAIDNSVYQGSSITSPSLVITSANSDHTGSYVCTATNTVGIGRSTTTILTVTGGSCVNISPKAPKMGKLKTCILTGNFYIYILEILIIIISGNIYIRIVDYHYFIFVFTYSETDTDAK